MNGIAPVIEADARGWVSGGRQSLAAITARLERTDSRALFATYQLNDQGLLHAMDGAVGRGARIDLLGDARLGGGGELERIAALVDRSEGAFHTYGSSDEAWYQHAKEFHFEEPDGSVESWITNLAPIPDTLHRTELSMIVGGATARAARDVARSALGGDAATGADLITSAARHGYLVNDPLRGATQLSGQVADLLAGNHARDLMVVTKGLEHDDSTSAIIAAHRAGRDVRVHVRDIARADGERLATAGVPTWVMSGGDKPRVNAVFAGDRGIVGSAFLWESMVGHAAPTSRDTGLLFDGALGSAIRGTALATTTRSTTHTPLVEAMRANALPDHI